MIEIAENVNLASKKTKLKIENSIIKKEKPVNVKEDDIMPKNCSKIFIKIMA